MWFYDHHSSGSIPLGKNFYINLYIRATKPALTFSFSLAYIISYVKNQYKCTRTYTCYIFRILFRDDDDDDDDYDDNTALQYTAPYNME